VEEGGEGHGTFMGDNLKKKKKTKEERRGCPTAPMTHIKTHVLIFICEAVLFEREKGEEGVLSQVQGEGCRGLTIQRW